MTWFHVSFHQHVGKCIMPFTDHLISMTFPFRLPNIPAAPLALLLDVHTWLHSTPLIPVSTLASYHYLSLHHIYPAILTISSPHLLCLCANPSLVIRVSPWSGITNWNQITIWNHRATLSLIHPRLTTNIHLEVKGLSESLHFGGPNLAPDTQSNISAASLQTESIIVE